MGMAVGVVGVGGVEEGRSRWELVVEYRWYIYQKERPVIATLCP